MVGAISADLAARGLNRVHIAGHSMGGAVAALLAIGEPEHFASVTLFAPGGFGEQIAGPLLRRYGEEVTSKGLRSYVGASEVVTEIEGQSTRLIPRDLGSPPVKMSCDEKADEEEVVPSFCGCKSSRCIPSRI